MVMVECKEYEDYSLDGYLHSNLTIINEEAIPNNWDCVYVLHGREGTGKTTIGTQISYFLDRTFGVTKIVWTADQFDKAIDNALEGDSILWDEAITGAMSQSHAEETSMRIVKKLTMIRKKKLKIGLCFPYLYLLNKYFVGRCLFSIYVYAKGFNSRGYAKFYDSRNTEKLYDLMKGKYRYDYAGAFSEADCNFFFRFTSRFCADVDEYDRLKTESSKLIEANTQEDKYRTNWIKTMMFAYNAKEKFSLRGLGRYLGYSHNSLSELIGKNKAWEVGIKDNIKLCNKKNSNLIKNDNNMYIRDKKEAKLIPKQKIVVKKESEEETYDEDYNEAVLNHSDLSGSYDQSRLKDINKQIKKYAGYINETE